jgi:hypothetical protein
MTPAAKPKRAPRPGEIALLASLAAGPRVLTSGPVGRCLKKGWCRRIAPDASEAGRTAPMALYALTLDGWRAIEGLDPEARRDTPGASLSRHHAASRCRTSGGSAPM